MAEKVNKGKKRKRHTDGSSKPSKKVAIEQDQNIKVAFHEPEKWAPVIGMNTFITHTSLRSPH
jgi:DNA-directed RNA polymerase I subunit RPA49